MGDTCKKVKIVGYVVDDPIFHGYDCLEAYHLINIVSLEHLLILSD